MKNRSFLLALALGLSVSSFCISSESSSNIFMHAARGAIYGAAIVGGPIATFNAVAHSQGLSDVGYNFEAFLLLAQVGATASGVVVGGVIGLLKGVYRLHRPEMPSQAVNTLMPAAFRGSFYGAGALGLAGTVALVAAVTCSRHSSEAMDKFLLLLPAGGFFVGAVAGMTGSLGWQAGLIEGLNRKK